MIVAIQKNEGKSAFASLQLIQNHPFIQNGLFTLNNIAYLNERGRWQGLGIAGVTTAPVGSANSHFCQGPPSEVTA